ncbi:acyl carrier protein [Actinomadura chibensis]|nr:phosphopantetheine-binding protein [Actinomadura chibensis]
MSATFDTLADVLATRFKVDRSKIAPDTTLEEFEFDSLFIVELELVLGEQFGITIEEQTFTPEDTLESIVDLVEGRRAAAGLIS